MDQIPSLPRLDQVRSRSTRRFARGCGFALGGLVVLVALAAAGLYATLALGPLTFASLPRGVADAIASHLGPDWRVTLRDSAIELDPDGAIALRAAGLEIHDPTGALVLRAPQALVSLDAWSLATGSFQPKAIDFRDLQLRALLHRDGSITYAADTEVDGAAPSPAAAPTGPPTGAAGGAASPAGQDAAAAGAAATGEALAPVPASPVAAGLTSVFALVLDPSGVLGVLDRARITNARLTLVDEEMRERAVYQRVDGLFRRGGRGNARSFELRLEGPRGAWRLAGDVGEGGTGQREGVLTLDDLPATDLLLLTGRSSLPIRTDLKISARAEVALSGNRLQALKLGIRTGEGTLLVDAKDFNPVAIERIAAAATWNERARTLDIAGLDYLGAGNAVHLTGTWAAGGAPEAAWTLALRGRDAVLRGAAPGDAPVRVAALDARLSGRDGGVVLEEMRVEGPNLHGTIEGSVGTGADRRGFALRMSGTNLGVRDALRLWPENITPPVRTYLAERLSGGRVDRVAIDVSLGADEFAAALGGGPMPDDALRITFLVTDATMAFADGAPPLARARVGGRITGRTTKIRDATADVPLGDGRGLAVGDGSFVVGDLAPGHVVAKVGLRLSGGADAVAALLRAPILRGVASAEIDPAQVKGQADMRVDFALPLDHPPDVADLPVQISGGLSDLSVEKVFGRDRLEGGKLAFTYDRAGFAMKGDARVSGSPAQIELRQPRPTPGAAVVAGATAATPAPAPVAAAGEAVVSVVLDEAGRARRGLPVAPQLAGSVPTRVTVPLSGKGKGAIRVEADLTKASVEGVIPGWSKAAGRAGKLAFLYNESASGAELREIALDSGPTSLRGTAAFSADGVLDRADLSTLKLSTGDDMRAQVERSGAGYRIMVRGPVADARPFLKALGTSAVGPGGAARDGGTREAELDLAVQILSGFNDEALTNATLKLSLRGRDVRSMLLLGRLRAAPVAAQVARVERGVPVLSVTADDAGGTLRYLDVYRHMVGGRLNLQIGLNEGPQAGTVSIHNFTLRNEPALKRIAAQGPPVSGPADDRGAAPASPDFDLAGVAFDRLNARFARNAGRIDFADAVISGPQMGFTLGGWLDYARDRTDVAGTFVPIYGLNNAFAQVPLFGPLLAGNQNEGLFAINFRVAGSVAAPAVSVNPLSAIAPGFLRKIFGVGTGDDLASGTASAPRNRGTER